MTAHAWQIDEQMQRALSARYVPHQPTPRQQMFLNLICDEALFGGMAYGGKSDALLMDAFKYVDVPGYSALVLRRTTTEAALSGSILDRARKWLAGTPARWKGETAIFPSRSQVAFGYLANENDKYRYASAEFQKICFDELTTFEETQYRFLFSRLRRPKLPCIHCTESEMSLEMRLVDGVWRWCHEYDPEADHEAEPDEMILAEYPKSKKRDLSIFQIPLGMRAGTNPGGIGAEWVKSRFIPDDFMPEDAKQQKIWSKEVLDADESDETYTVRTYFIPSRKEDNPYADVRRYRQMLSRLGRVERKQLEEGDWSITGVGRPFFTHLALELYKKRAPATGELKEIANSFGESNFVFTQGAGGILDIWEHPKPGHRYVMGCDTASGRDANRGEGKLHTDWSVCQIHDLDTHEQVARLRGRISQRHFGEYWYRLHVFYNLAYLVPAVTGGYGQAALDRAMDIGDGRGIPIEFIYVQRNKKKPDHPPISTTTGGLVLGFVETKPNRIPLYSALDSAYVGHEIEIYDAVTINEAYSFEWDKDGKPQARHGCFDDTQTAYALVIEGIPYAPWGLWSQMNKVKIPPQVIKYGLGPGETEQQRQQRNMEARIRASRVRRHE